MKRYRKLQKPFSPKKQVLTLSRQLASVKAQHSAACQQVIALEGAKQTAVEKAYTLKEENTQLRQLNDSMIQPVLSQFRHASFDHDPNKMVKSWRLTGQFALGINVDVGNVIIRETHPDARAACIESIACYFSRQVYEAAKKSLSIIP
jgi:hypothetical protein